MRNPERSTVSHVLELYVEIIEKGIFLRNFKYLLSALTASKIRIPDMH